MEVGSKVICINDSNWSKQDLLHFHSLPVRGHIYVVRSVFSDAPDPFCPSPLALVGIEGEMIFVMDFYKRFLYMEAHFCGKRFEEILTPLIIPELDETTDTVNRDI